MAFSLNVQTALSRHQQAIETALRQATSMKSDVIPPQPDVVLEPFYGQMHYHLGWVDSDFAPTTAHTGKLLRPTLLLLAYEASGAWGLVDEAADPSAQTEAYLHRALFAAAAIELTHNCTLIHDDIEDGDAERRHRPTVWNLWGIPQAINTGDGMFTLARLTLWRVLDEAVEGELAACLGALLDCTCLAIFEGQYLDMSFEHRLDISISMYLNMIHHKTAALMACTVEMGAPGNPRCRDDQELAQLRMETRNCFPGARRSPRDLGHEGVGQITRRRPLPSQEDPGGHPRARTCKCTRPATFAHDLRAKDTCHTAAGRGYAGNLRANTQPCLLPGVLSATM
jgi:geranylgeranyl diphosphate synthase type I